MRSVVALVALGALTVVGVTVLADLTQSRSDASTAGTRSRILLDVETRSGYEPELAAQGLWATCQQTVEHIRLESFDVLGDGQFALVIEPGLGEHARRRLLGCLEDTTIDRVLADVVEVREVPAR